MVHYVSLMHRELGTPPTLHNAERLTQNHPVDVHVFGPAASWSTSKRTFDPEEFTVRHLPPQQSPRYRLIGIDQRVFLHTRDGDFDIYFEVHDVSMAEDGMKFAIFILCTVVGVLLLVYYATRSLFSPIDDIERGVYQFAEGNFAYRISKRRTDQFGDLVDSINNMAQDVFRMLEAKRQFLLGISHELRSPLTRCKVNLALLEDSEPRQDIDTDISTMDQLIGELLESERLNSPHQVIRPEAANIRKLIEKLTHEEFAGLAIKLSLDDVSADVDIARMKLLLRNLIQNAARYNRQGKPINIALCKAGDAGFILSVEDHGGGISSKHIAFLTEPFYRADASRRRLTGGYGLGLYLCKMIVKAHGGQIEIQSKPGCGTNIICQFPGHTA